METLWHVLSVIASLSVPFIAWLGKSYLDLHNRLIKAETRLEERSKTLTEVRDRQIVDTHRLTQAESHIDQLRDMHRDMLRVTEARHAELSAKLEILPRLDESINNLTQVCRTFAPREVHEAHMDAQDARIKAIEDKVK